MAAELLEKVKIEIRSILLSSKHGVAAESIRSDYEMLMCQKIPLRELGFKDVQSLMRAIPDVAREVRSYTGEITYHAVCDESTAHIQKLVNNQMSKRKKPSHGGRGKRHNAHGRGGYMGRGGRFHGHRGSVGGGDRHLTYRPRAAHFMNEWQFDNIPLASGDYGNNTKERRRRLSSSEHADASVVTLAQTLRAIVGQSGDKRYPSKHDTETYSQHHKSPLYDLRIGVSQSGRREISALTETQYDLRDRLNRKRESALSEQDDVESVDYSVRLVMGTTDSSGSMVNNKVMKENRTFTKNLPPRLQRQQQQQSSSVQQRQALSPVQSPTVQQYLSGENTVYTMDNRNWVPPKDGHLYVEAFNSYFAQRGEAAPKIDIIPGKIRKVKGFYASLNYQEKYYYPLEIMQTEEFARQNVMRSFCQEKGISLLHNGQAEVSTTDCLSRTSPVAQEQEEVPSVQANSTQSHRPKVNDSHATSQEQTTGVGNISASQEKPADLPETLAKVYQILKPNGIWLAKLPSLYETNYKESLNLDLLSAASQWPQYFTLEQFAGNRCTIYPVAKGSPETTDKISTQVLVPPALQPDISETAEKRSTQVLVPPGLQPDIPKTAEKISTQVLVPPGLQPDIPKTAEKRSTPVLVPPGLQPDIPKTAEKIKIQVLVPPALQPAVGSRLQMFFSFAYSTEDVYLQRADMENLVYEIDDILNKNCLNSSPPDVDTVALNSLVAASYENSWYRAQVLSLENTAVKVYFIDYGNQEEVSVADLRPIPPHLRLLNTPSLAIKCALRKTKVGEWQTDVIKILADLSETNTVLSAEIVEHKGDQCIVDLYTLEGSLMNDTLLLSVSSPTVQQLEEVSSATKSAPQGDLQTVKTTPAAAARLFADDPDPLMIPDSELFAVYVCRVMSENTVLLRIVDDEYSDKLDELEQEIADNVYSWPIPQKIIKSNIYACMVFAASEDAEDVEYDEQGKERYTDQNKYHRVRVLKEHKDGRCDCYLPDHGHNETLNRSQLREIDPRLNITLSYQAIMARLHGLDSLPDMLKPMAVRLLIKLLTNGATLYAVKKGKSAEKRKDDPGGIDVNITNRVRKIISCMTDIQPSSVAKIYQGVFGESIENVEEIIQNIPGYGYWREILEVNLIDTSHEEDLNINEFVLAAIEEMDRVQSSGGSAEDVWRDMFCSDTSQTDTDGGSIHEELDDWQGSESLRDSMSLDPEVGKVDVDTQPGHVSECVQDLPVPIEAEEGVQPASGKALYTWKTNQDTSGGAVSTPATTRAASASSSVCDNCQLPKFWTYPLLKFVSMLIVRVENPSDFVAIPMEQRGALEKLEMAIAQYFSANKEEAAVTCSDKVLYAVKFKDVYRRALYVNLLEDVVKVFFPDHHCYDTVPPSQLLPLPQQFYSLPFLARKMRLGSILPPQGQDWPVTVTQWFKGTVSNKTLYALVTGEEECSSSSWCFSGTLVVRLIDTSGSEDLVLDEYMASSGMAVCEPSSD